jgi:hypothetical protein
LKVLVWRHWIAFLLQEYPLSPSTEVVPVREIPVVEEWLVSERTVKEFSVSKAARERLCGTCARVGVQRLTLGLSSAFGGF